MLIADAIHLLICPDCRGPLSLGESSLACSTCSLLFPITEDSIPIILPRRARNPNLERPLVEALPPSNQRDETLACLGSASGATWEWEDEVYWSQEYAKRATTDEKDWRNCLLEREPMVRRIVDRIGAVGGRVILDVGAGEGQNFRYLLSPHTDDSTTYIAADISLSALRLNRARSARARSLYILCSADRLPFRDGVIDLLCYFGILHHTERKAGTISEDVRMLNRDQPSYVILNEVLERPTVSAMLRMSPEPQSAHEERIAKDAIFEAVRAAGVSPIYHREFHTPIYSAALSVANSFTLANKTTHRLVMFADAVASQLLGPVVPVFRPATIQLVLERPPDRSVRP